MCFWKRYFENLKNFIKMLKTKAIYFQNDEKVLSQQSIDIKIPSVKLIQFFQIVHISTGWGKWNSDIFHFTRFVYKYCGGLSACEMPANQSAAYKINWWKVTNLRSNQKKWMRISHNFIDDSNYLIYWKFCLIIDFIYRFFIGMWRMCLQKNKLIFFKDISNGVFTPKNIIFSKAIILFFIS